jgi:ABC-type cobalamin/Fe3+-siderophores transport system ATPase subunit
VLELQGLSRRYGDVVALDDLSFTVREGQMFGFVGPNGAGKTTTMRIVLGVLEPDRGEVRWRGRPAECRGDAVTAGKQDLDALIEEITVDCFGEDEELTGFLTYLEDALEQPVEATVIGVPVTISELARGPGGLPVLGGREALASGAYSTTRSWWRGGGSPVSSRQRAAR